MSVVAEDYFNRVAADLTTSPVGRWGAPAGGGGVNAWQADGQYARPGSTFGASTRGQLRWTGTSPASDFGELRCRLARPNTQVTELGIFVRAHRTNTATHERLAIVWNGGVSPTRWELRSYSSYTSYFMIQAAPDTGATGTGFVMGTGVFHDLRIRWTTIPGSTTNMAVGCWVDNIPIIPAMLWIDTWRNLAGGLSAYRGFGVEILTAAGYVAASDTAYFDNIEFDNLVDFNAEAAPTLTADPTLTPITVSTEGTAVDTLPFTPDIGEVVTQQWFTVRKPLEAGYEATWARFQVGRLMWRIGHASLTLTEMATLETFLADHAGQETPFDFDDDAGATRTVYFVNDTFAFTQYGMDNVRVEYVVEAVA